MWKKENPKLKKVKKDKATPAKLSHEPVYALWDFRREKE
jgi:hypothetical protein